MKALRYLISLQKQQNIKRLMNSFKVIYIVASPKAGLGYGLMHDDHETALSLYFANLYPLHPSV